MLNALAQEMVVACRSWQYAQDIADHLFERRLIVAHLEEDAARIRDELTKHFSQQTLEG